MIHWPGMKLGWEGNKESLANVQLEEYEVDARTILRKISRYNLEER
jgi:hypothetical protein